MPKGWWNLKIVRSLTALAAVTASIPAMGQIERASSLPAAPSMQISLSTTQLQMSQPAGSLPATGSNTAGTPSALGSATTTQAGTSLTRRQAEQMAIRNNPRISASRLLALAQGEVVREARSANMPVARASVAAVDANDGSRFSAFGLASSRLVTHAGTGMELSQLVTDFGRVHNLVMTQKLEHQAAQANAVATTQEIVFATDQAFYNALSAQAILQVAKQTVATRAVTETQVRELTQNKLRSTLDLSIAEVNASEAKLMEIDAKNQVASAMADLDAVLGLDHNQWFNLVENTSTPAAPPLDYHALLRQALSQRPDLQARQLQTQSAKKFERAQRDQLLPSISLFGTAGATPVRVAQYYNSNWWGAVGVNLDIPVFNGFLYSAQANEAKYQAQADQQQERDLRDQIVRDLRAASLQGQTAYQKLSVTAQLVKQADMSLALANTRYKLGLSSIVELSQAQLQQTSAQIEATNARYQYRLALSAIRFQIGQNP